jgi:signal peptidase II
MKKSMLRWMALLALLLAGCRADQVSKVWAAESFQEGPRTLVPGLLEFRYAENRAIAFSMLRSVPEHIRRPLIFTLGGVSMAALLIYAFTMRRQGFWRLLPFALILGGGVGNFIDRIVRGYVVDFVHVHWKDAWSFPIFNVADSLVSVGVALWIIQGVFGGKEAEPATPDSAPAVPAPAA